MHLALESEWYCSNKEKLLEDFYKLLDAKALLKVYVFESNEKKLDSHLQILIHAVSFSRLALNGEKYLLIPHIDLKRTDDALTERIQGLIVYPSGQLKKLATPVDLVLR
jgi:hypothetical protein